MKKKNGINKLWLICAKLKLRYVEIKAELVAKIGEEIVVEARAKLLFRQGGGWSDKTKLMLNSAFN